MSVLARIPMDGTFDQVAPLDRLTGFKKEFSFDLKSATGPLPVLNSLMALPSYLLNSRPASALAPATALVP